VSQGQAIAQQRVRFPFGFMNTFQSRLKAGRTVLVRAMRVRILPLELPCISDIEENEAMNDDELIPVSLIEDWPQFGFCEAEAEIAYREAGDHPRAMQAAIRAALDEGIRQWRVAHQSDTAS
jgi:hypothetical protein